MEDQQKGTFIIPISLQINFSLDPSRYQQPFQKSILLDNLRIEFYYSVHTIGPLSLKRREETRTRIFLFGENFFRATPQNYLRRYEYFGSWFYDWENMMYGSQHNKSEASVCLCINLSRLLLQKTYFLRQINSFPLTRPICFDFPLRYPGLFLFSGDAHVSR